MVLGEHLTPEQQIVAIEQLEWITDDTGGRDVLCVVRHGETDWNVQQRMQGHTDIPLNAEGVRQAQAAAERLAAFRWAALWSSDLQRAHRTAELIAARVGLEPKLWDQLRERNLGELEGKDFFAVRERYPEYLTGEVALPTVETRRGLQERALKSLNVLADRYRGQRIIVVTHGAFINSVLTVLSGGRM